LPKVSMPAATANATRLNAVFAALCDPTRRGILAALASGRRPVGELAEPAGMSLPGFMKHLRVLEDAGLLVRMKEGRVVHCTLNPDPMKDAAAWLERYRQFWEARLDALARYLDEEVAPWPKPAKNRRSASPAASRPRPKKSGPPGRSRKR
jgi:DNA-binding transcriptional ArsR family regulator